MADRSETGQAPERDPLAPTALRSTDELSKPSTMWLARIARLALLAIFIGIVFLVGLVLTRDTASISINAAERDASIFLGTSVEYLVDTAGQLEMNDIEGEWASSFVSAGGNVVNRGVAPTNTTAMWLRIPAPAIADEAESWTLSLREARVRNAEFFIPQESGGYSILSWTKADGQARLRYPAFNINAEEVAGKTLYLRVETASSLRAMLWLQPTFRFVEEYSREVFAIALILGIVTGLVAYLISIGVILRSGVLGHLAALALTFATYVAADRAVIEEIILPGAVLTSGLLSVTATMLIYPALINFEVHYLQLSKRAPRLAILANGVVLLLVLLSLETAREWVQEIRFVRLHSAFIGLAALGFSVLLAVLALGSARWRAILFLLCWIPALAGGVVRLSLDAMPGSNAHPLLVNAVYAGGIVSLLAFSILASLDLQARERKLRLKAEEAETRFRNFAESASDSFWEADIYGKLTFFRGPDCDILGLSKGQELGSALRHHADQSNEPAIQVIESAVKNCRVFRRIVVTALRGDRVHHFAVSATPVHDLHGRCTGFSGTISDVTVDHERRERTAHQQKMAALGQLAGGMAHEISNLLHPIINLGRRVRNSTAAQPQVQHLMTLIVDAAVQMNEIVAAVRASSRADEGPVTLRSLSEAVHQSLETISTIIPATVTLTEHIDSISEPRVPLGEMLQVLTNLVSNSIQAFSGAGAITIQLSADPVGDGAQLVVTDDGCGMDEETRRRALDPFFTTKPAGQGTGLGLPAVYGIVRGWGGSIDIASSPGGGTRIEIHIPSDRRHRARG